MTPRFNPRALVVWSILFGIAAAAGLILVPAGTDDMRMVAAFSYDEPACVQVILAMIRTGDFIFPEKFFHYQSVYFYLTFAVLTVARTFSAGADLPMEVLLALRGVSYAMAMASLVVVGLILRRMGRDRFAVGFGVVAALALPEFLYYAFHAHPDTTQLFFILMTFYFLTEHALEHKPAPWFLAAAAMALAAGTKYVGFFMIPSFALYSVLYARQMRPAGKAGVFDPISALLLGASVFGAVFLATNPHWVLRFQDSVESFLWLRRANSADVLGISWEWLSVLADMGYGFVALGLLWILRTARAIASPNRNDLGPVMGAMAFWCAGFIGFLLASYHGGLGGRHLLPVTGCLVIGATDFLFGTVLGELEAKISRGVRRRTIATLAILAALAASLNGFSNAAAAVREHLTYSRDPRVETGKFLAAHFPPETRIFYQYYAYIPPVFTEVRFFFPTTHRRAVQLRNPDVLVTTPDPRGPTPAELIQDFPEFRVVWARAGYAVLAKTPPLR